MVLTILAAAVVVLGPGALAQSGDAKQSGKQASHAKVLTRAELDELLAKPGQVLIVDVRRPDEISRVGGFPVYLNVQINDLEKSVAWIPKDRPLVAVSNHAHRAATAADILAKAGFKVAGAAGAQLYESDGGKLTKVVPPPSSPNAKKQ
jgi:rhodanese-related sulfurtransferase